jgi:hypothetical protein
MEFAVAVCSYVFDQLWTFDTTHGRGAIIKSNALCPVHSSVFA